MSAAMVASIALHRPTGPLRSAGSLVLAASQIFFVGTFVVRYARARGERRTTMRALLVAVAPPHALVGAGILVAAFSPRGSSAMFLVSIPILSLLPISAVVAFMRHNLWGSKALVSRVATLTGAGALAFAVSSALGAAFASRLGVALPQALLGSTGGALAAAGLVTAMLRLSDQRFFRARAEYKPAVERLSEHLNSLTDPADVSRAVEQVVRRSLSCDDATLVLEGEAPPHAPAFEHKLSVPLVLGEKTLGALDAYKTRRTDALFTSEDLVLLRTIANQAALAVAYTRSYQELEERRRRQVQAWRGEREALLETVAAEVAHEIRYPINFFRAVFHRDASRNGLDHEEIDIGREEVERLERLVSGLRRLEHRRLNRTATPLTDVVARAELLLRDTLGERAIGVAIPEGVALRADVDQVMQVLVNLLSNALDAVSEGGGDVGIEWRTEKNGGSLVVWDSGPGFQGDPAEIFTPWFTTKPKGTGLGLAISHRIVRAHGWTIDARRVAARTEFDIAIPSEDVVRGV
jgi:signal transduction histidine kinase